MADFGSIRVAGDATVTRNIKVSGQIKSLLPSGTAPLVLVSNTLVTNLNSDLLDGQHGSYYLDWANLSFKPNYIINITPGVGLTLSGTAGVGWTPTLSMGTPSTLTTATTNSATGTTHTHQITTASGNTASTIVARDGSGNFSAGTITAALSGNASTATKWETTRTITLTGGVSSSATNIDGSGNVSITTTFAATVPITTGGTGTTSTTQWGVIYGASATALGATAAGTAGQVLKSNGASAPTWQTLDMSYLPDSAFKKSVRLATTANITLSAPQTIDGIAVVAEDRVLVKNQTTASENGIYVVKAGAWIRAVSADASTEIAGGVVNVDSGTQGGFLYSNNFKTTDTLGTTAMPWYKVYSEFDATTAGTASKLALRDSSGNITANGIIGTTTLTLDSTTTSAVNLGTGASAKTVTIGNATGATSVVLNAGTGALSIGANAIARTNTFANTTGAGITYLYGGTGGISLLTGTTGAISIDSGTTGAINVGTNANAKTVTIGNGTGATSVVINAGTGALNIGTNAIARTITLGNATGASGVVVNSGTAGVIFNQVATGIFKIQTTAIPTTDAVQITNAGYAVTTAGVNALAITYVGGAAAIESSAMRLDLTPGTTSGGIWSGLRILPTASAATGVTQNGIKFDNITAGAGTDNMLLAGTGWDNILSYGGTSIINGTGLVNATKLTGIVPTANGGTGTTSTTGSGSVVFATSPTLVTPVLGAATGTSLTVRSSAAYDGVSIAGRSGGTGTHNVSLVPATLSASRTITLPDATGTVALEGIRSTSVSVLTSAWSADTTYPDFGYRASITISGVTATMIPHVYFSYADSSSGIYSTFSDTYAGGVYIYATEIPSATITIPLIECAR